MTNLKTKAESQVLTLLFETIIIRDRFSELEAHRLDSQWPIVPKILIDLPLDFPKSLVKFNTHTFVTITYRT